MENSVSNAPKLKLNMKRTLLIGFAFFGILLLWQVYDSWCPTFLTELFAKAFNYDIASNPDQSRRVQYLVGVMMAIDNLAALILLPIFGNLSDKTKSPIGKRMPYILVGTFVCAVAFPFIPVLFRANNLAGVIAMMGIVVLFAMMYRNPAVALMPDITPKPLRSKANGIINIMGYIGGFFATIVGVFFVLSEYLGKTHKHPWQEGNFWVIMIPFLLGSVLMLVSALVLFFTVKENKVAEEVAEDMRRGEEEAQTVDKIDDDKPMSKANLTMLLLILAAEFFWFMADNGISTFMGNYTLYYLKASTASNSINTIIGGVGSVAGFALGGLIASKIGRKWTLWGGLALATLAFVLWAILGFSIAPNGKFPVYIYAIWFMKGFGMSLVHVNSFPMVVELCSSKKIGRFTGYYYAASMAAQTLTPTLLGLLLLVPSFGWQYLPVYALICTGIGLIVFLFVKNIKSNKTTFKKGLESLDVEE